MDNSVQKIKVKIPMTSANLGAGFDTLGLALSGYNYFTATLLDEGLTFSGCKEEFQNKNNLLYKSINYVFEKKDITFKQGLDLHFETTIKDCSGLGSSATCIVGGLLIGAKILEEVGVIVTKEELIDMAIEIEGHGDNVVPAFLGSLTIVMEESGKFVYKKVHVSNNFKFAILTSDLEKESTKHLRGVLKQEVTLKDASFNVSHALMTLYALQNGDKDLLKISMEDKLHEQYRKRFIENFDDIKNKALETSALSLNISGSGPSLILIYDETFLKGEFIDFLKTLNNNWEFLECNVDIGGATIE